MLAVSLGTLYIQLAVIKLGCCSGTLAVTLGTSYILLEAMKQGCCIGTLAVTLETSYILLHCEKSLFVLASHQKILALRKENPAIDTRTICLPPLEFF